VWSNGNLVLGCVPGSCGVPTTYTNFTPFAVGGLAATLSSSFVLMSGGDNSNLIVRKNTLDGQNEQTVYTGTPGGGAPGPVAATPNSSHVYWSQMGVGTVYDCTQTSCGGTPTTTRSIATTPTSMVATLNDVYVGTAAGLLRLPSDLSTSPATLVNGVIAGVALSPNVTSRVYFATGTTIQSCSTGTTTCAPTTHYPGSTTSISAIAAADDAVYWIEGTQIMRLAL